MAVRVKIPYKFEARDYQKPFLQAVQDSMEGRSDVRYFYQIWHRRAGKDKTNIADVVPARLTIDPVLVKYVWPTLVMGRDNLWTGLGSDGFKYLDHIPEAIRAGRPNNGRMTIPVKNSADPDTPSIFQVAGSDNPDSLRGGNPKLIVFSEWADQDPYAFDVVDPIVRENDGIVIFNTTPKGDNHARNLFEFAKTSPKWHVEIKTVDDTGLFTEKEMEELKAETIKRFLINGRSQEEAEAYIEQEYYCSFDSPVIGSYYGNAMMRAEKDGRIASVPYHGDFLVNTAWDLGMDDSMSIWFYQRIGGQFRFIDYYESSGEGIGHYISVLANKGYNYGQHFAPHDIKVREIGTGKSRYEVAKKMGITFVIVQRSNNINEGIDACRRVLGRCAFDKDKCARGVAALKNYRKDWDEKNKVFRSKPKHDWSSHGADSFRTFGTGDKEPSKPKQQTDFGGVKPLYPGMPG